MNVGVNSLYGILYLRFWDIFWILWSRFFNAIFMALGHSKVVGSLKWTNKNMALRVITNDNVWIRLLVPRGFNYLI